MSSTVEAMTPQQRLGQLFMVGFDANAPLGSRSTTSCAARTSATSSTSAGGTAPTRSTRTSEHLQGLVSGTSTGDVGLLIAADQEGGEVHQLRGEGFTRPPSAKEQATMSSAALTRAATGWARELKAAGVNVNLAPVTDTVPADIGRANEPIGRYGRQYGSDPETVERASAAFLKGMLAGGVEGTVKHFPGLGRIRNNTDFSSTGITDDVTDADDPYLQPFAAGVKAGAGLVMVGSARYSKLDPEGAGDVLGTDRHRPAARRPRLRRRRHHRRRQRRRRCAARRPPSGRCGSSTPAATSCSPATRRTAPAMIAAVKAKAADDAGVRRQGRGVGAAGGHPQGADGPAPLLDHQAVLKLLPLFREVRCTSPSQVRTRP